MNIGPHSRRRVAVVQLGLPCALPVELTPRAGTVLETVQALAGERGARGCPRSRATVLEIVRQAPTAVAFWRNCDTLSNALEATDRVPRDRDLVAADQRPV